MKEFEHGDYECIGCGAVIDDEIDILYYKNKEGKIVSELAPTHTTEEYGFAGYKCSECGTKHMFEE